MEEMHQQEVSQMIKSAEGGAGLLHKLGEEECKILKEIAEDAKLLDRCEAKKKNGQEKHWQCGEDVQNVEDKHWKKEELKKLEEALPMLEECELEEVSRLYKAKTGVGNDGFLAKVHLDLTTQTMGKSSSSWRRRNLVEGCRNKLAQRCSA